jgi:MFS family permease
MSRYWRGISRILVMGGCAIAGASVLLYPLATSIPLLIGARLVSGVGEAAVFTGAASAAQDMAPDHRRGEAASYFSVALYGGIGIGPVAGETLLRATNFTTVFLTAGAISLLSALIALKLPVGRTTSPDAANSSGGGFRKLVHPSALGPGVILFLGLVPTVAFGAFLPLYGEQVGLDNIGPVLAVYAGLVLVVRIFGAKLPDVMGWKLGSSLALGGVLVGAGIIGLWQSAAAVWIGTVTLAIGMSLLFPALFLAVMSSAPEEERTHAIGSFSLFFDIAQGLGAALVGAVVSLSNEQGGFLAAAACALVGIVMQRVLAARIGASVSEGTARRNRASAPSPT